MKDRKLTVGWISLFVVSAFVGILTACAQIAPSSNIHHDGYDAGTSETMVGLMGSEEVGIKQTEVLSTAMPTDISPSLMTTLTPFQPIKWTPTPSPTVTPQPTESPVVHLLFTGTIVTGRCVQEAVDQHGNADFLYQDVSDMIMSADYAIGVLNATISDYSPRTGCVETFVLVGSPENADALARAGFDMLNVATNHIKNCGLTNCGDRAFFDTLANLRRVGIAPVGAGLNLEKALEPVIIQIKGVRFGFVALGEIEKNAFASENTPGIAVLTDENLIKAIKKAKGNSDVVIVMPHWGSDYSHTPNYRQLHFAQIAVDAGADLVVGDHAHVIQGYQMMDDVPVFYGLGSFVFDQDWSLETQQGLMLTITFEGPEYQGFKITPVHIDGNGHVNIASDKEAAAILSQFEALSNNLK
ncbi:MAG: CapA family protein [Anaerolineales bacterium]|nr:CapA family protein [Anaerolineales bacterium]